MRVIIALFLSVCLVGCATGPRYDVPITTEISELYSDLIEEQIEQTDNAQESTEIIWNLIPPIEEETTDIIEEVEIIEETTDHMTDVMDAATEEELAPSVEEPLREDVAIIDESAADIKESAEELIDYAALLRARRTS